MELKDVLRKQRRVLGITQSDLAELAEVSPATIKDIERGKGNPSWSTAGRILEALGLRIDFRPRIDI